MLDASSVHAGGGFTFAANALRALAHEYPKDAFRVIARNPALTAFFIGLDNLEVDNLPTPGLFARAYFTWVRLPRLAAEWRADALFVIGDLLPFSAPCPVIASSQNANLALSLREMWSIYGLRQLPRLALLREFARLSAGVADAVHYVSEDSARRLGEALGVPAERRWVAYHGTHLEPATELDPSPHPRPYLLAVGSIYVNKNYVRLAEAWRVLAERDPRVPDLVIVGDAPDPAALRALEAARARAGSLSGRFALVGAVPYDQIARWYRHAELFVFPSYLEAFGLPLLEAMEAGVPTVAADIPVFRELAADAAHYANAYDVDALATAMHTLLYDSTLRSALSTRARERARRFQWESTARALMQIFEGAIALRSERTVGESAT